LVLSAVRGAAYVGGYLFGRFAVLGSLRAAGWASRWARGSQRQELGAAGVGRPVGGGAVDPFWDRVEARALLYLDAMLKTRGVDDIPEQVREGIEIGISLGGAVALELAEEERAAGRG
jgi:hypothetical protein